MKKSNVFQSISPDSGRGKRGEGKRNRFLLKFHFRLNAPLYLWALSLVPFIGSVSLAIFLPENNYRESNDADAARKSLPLSRGIGFHLSAAICSVAAKPFRFNESLSFAI